MRVKLRDEDSVIELETRGGAVPKLGLPSDLRQQIPMDQLEFGF